MSKILRHKIIKACVGILYDIKTNQVLLSKRPEGKNFADYWEFPGGKLEQKETSKEAVIRELYEEVGVVVDINQVEYLTNVEQRYTNGKVTLDVMLIHNWSGLASAREGQQLYWYDLATPLQVFPLLPTTEKIFKLIRSNIKFQIKEI